ncbi:hypothetical protein M2408_001661 [Sphingobacterium sp. BIGb0165]|nr:hypothetical protein [Sphingobacterium sp. BIGb0165]
MELTFTHNINRQKVSKEKRNDANYKSGDVKKQERYTPEIPHSKV